MKNLSKILVPVLVVAVGVAITVALVKTRPQPERVLPEPNPPLVRTVTTEIREAALTVRSQGTVLPRTEANLVAEVAGRILDVSASLADGGYFRRGQVLARLDARDYQLAVEQARAQVAQAETVLALEVAEAELAVSEWQELGRGEASPLVRREPQLAQARATVDAAKAALAAAELALQRTTLTAPFEGRVRRKLADVGQYVGPGTPVAQIYAVDYAEVRLPVPLDQLAFVDLPTQGGGEAPTPVTLRADVGGQVRAWQGEIVRSSGEIDPQTRMLDLIARVDDPYKGSAGRMPLAVGLFVEAEIVGRQVPGVIELPRSALRNEDRVLVVDETNQLRFRKVEVLRRQAETVLITAGLEPGETVCVSPLEAAVEGMPVRITEEGAAS